MSDASNKTILTESSDSGRPPGLEELAKGLSGGYRSVGAMVYEILRDAIVSGTLAPGEKLRQETLAEAIGVSRLPVRSALIQLESDGLVQFHDRRGAVVATLSHAQVTEIYELRELIEVYALRQAMKRMTPEKIARLRTLADGADNLVEGPEFVQARTAFYEELYDTQARPLLWQIVGDLRLKVGGYLLSRRMEVGHGHTHEALVDAVATGKAEPAVAILTSHLRSVRDGVLALLAPAPEVSASSSSTSARAAGSPKRPKL